MILLFLLHLLHPIVEPFPIQGEVKVLAIQVLGQPFGGVLTFHSTILLGNGVLLTFFFLHAVVHPGGVELLLPLGLELARLIEIN